MFACQTLMLHARASPSLKSAGQGEQRTALLNSSRAYRAAGVRCRKFTIQASNLEEDFDKATVGGGGYSGQCDVDTMREAAADCDGLSGVAQEACWADSGCNKREVEVAFERKADGTFAQKRESVPQGREEQALKHTVGGGGYNGYCDIDDIRRLRKECEGLTGEALTACWADSGCDIEEVTKHYTAVAGIDKDEYRVYIAHDGSIVADGLPTGEYNISAWWAGVNQNAGDADATGLNSAPACSPFQSEDCMMVCQLVGDFDLVCPGLPDGKYHITNLAEADCSKSGDTVECKVQTWE